MVIKGKKKLSKKSKMDFQSLVSRIENMILTGAFKPRERLIEATLSEMFGVSRYSVRDAFKVLETKGMVTVTPFRGVSVNELSKQEVEEIFVIRAALEQLATRMSSENASAEDIKALRRMVKKIEDAHHEDDFVAMVAADTNFHDYIFQMSQNTTLRRMINDLRNRCHIIRYSSWSSPNILQQVMEEHCLIVDAIEVRDVVKLNDLSEKHLSHAKQSYLLRLKAENAVTDLRR
jgi:DNA-binding GntR family transcriptional regulator